MLKVFELPGINVRKKKKAYKKGYRFLSERMADKYSLFLKQKILDLNPKYYVVANRTAIDTPDGLMYALRITTDIEFPNLEPIAECWINGSDIYLWRDQCWGIAVDDKGKEIRKVEGPPIIAQTTGSARTKPMNKTIILFQIGVDEIE